MQGGGHTDFFAPDDEKKPHARPKYDQQNSSNLNFCMGTTDPNEKVAAVIPADHEDAASAHPISNGSSSEASAPAEQNFQLDGAAEVAANANLPKYHHHRSTALW